MSQQLISLLFMPHPDAWAGRIRRMARVLLLPRLMKIAAGKLSFFLPLLGLGMWLAICPCAAAAVINMPSMNQSNMLWCAANAQDGDTFVFPGEKVGYSTDVYNGNNFLLGVIWTKAVTLQFGAGATITNLLGTSKPYRYVFALMAAAGGKPIRITGLTIDGNKMGGGIYAWGNQKNIRIDHCNFNYCGHNVNSEGAIIVGPAYGIAGVIDHCNFTNNEVCVEYDGGNNQSWANDNDGWHQLGTTNGLYIEDCYVFNDNGDGYINVNGTQLFYNGQGARTCFRHNTVKSISDNNVPLWDSHGNNAVLPTEHRGTIWTVIENNTIDIKTSYLHFYIRGGMYIMINNAITGQPGASALSLTEEEGWYPSSGTPMPGLNGDRTVWPAQDQITNSWIVNNTYNGVLINAGYITNHFRSLAINNNDRTFIQEGRDFWVTNNLPAANRYTPLVYPHPRVTADSVGQTNVATSPQISVNPPSLDFGSVSLGSSKDLTVQVWNVGGGTLAGTATVAAPFSIVGSPSYSLAANVSQNLVLRYAPTQQGTDSQTVSFTGGGASVLLNGAGTTMLLIADFSASSGTITGPFTSNPDGTIYQPVWSSTPTAGGRASYAFDVTDAGNYIVSADAYAPDDSANSFYVNIDLEPFSPLNIWTIPVSDGFSNQPVTWLVTGSPTLHIWWLNPGAHQLIVRGREANATLGQITVSKYVPSLVRPATPQAAVQ